MESVLSEQRIVIARNFPLDSKAVIRIIRVMSKLQDYQGYYQFLYLFPVARGFTLDLGEWNADLERGVGWAKDQSTAQAVHKMSCEGAAVFDHIPSPEELKDIDWYDGGVGLLAALESLMEMKAPIWRVAIKDNQVRFDFNPVLGISAPVAYVLGAIGGWDNEVIRQGQTAVVIRFP